MTPNSVFVIHAFSTFYLVGLIWMVQIVHYPLMDRVNSDRFAAFETDHSRIITPVVAPMMLLELATGALLALGYAPTWMPLWAAWTGLFAILLIWASTFFIQVPCHAILASGFDEAVHQRLVTTNWIRTILWTARGVMVGVILWRALENTGAL